MSITPPQTPLIVTNTGSAPAGARDGSAASAGSCADTAYQDWIQRHSLREINVQLQAERMILKWHARPLIHLFISLEKGEEALLADTLNTLGMQLYKEWRLTVIADFPAPLTAFDELPMLSWIHVADRGCRAAVINQAATRTAADWIGFFDPGVRFEPHFLLTCADYINLRPGWHLIYTDDDVVDGNGARRDPRFKPDFNLDMLRSVDYLGKFLVHRLTFLAAGGYSGLTGAQTYDTALRVLDHSGEAAIGHISDVLCHLPAVSARRCDAGNQREALRGHLRRRRIAGRVEPGYQPEFHRVIYEYDAPPTVSIIIPTRDRPELIRPCLDSLLSKTAYSAYEVLVIDNQSTDPEVLEYYQELRDREPRKVRILSYPHPFNFSAICNFGAGEARGDYLLLLNNDTQVVQEEWLTRMMMQGRRPEVGVVGARLVFPGTGKIQHAGIVLGMKGIAGHPFGYQDLNDPGVMGRTLVDQNYSAVTAACMLVRKSVYGSVGGMDAEDLKVLFNDVDLCLRVGRAGYKVVWTPYAVMVHHQSSSLEARKAPAEPDAERACRRREHETMLARWLPALARDPAYNPHLSLLHADFRPENTAVVNWDVNFHDRPRILGTPLSGGSGHYRVKAPLHALSRAGLAECDYVQSKGYFDARIFSPIEIERAAPDVLLHHAPVHDAQLDALELFQRFNKVFQIFSLDDLITQLPEKSPAYKHFYRDMRTRLQRALAACDRMIVTTAPLAELARNMIDDIRLVPNYLEKAHWLGLDSRSRREGMPRVGWAGAQQHHGDLAVLADVVRATAHEVDWIFFGMCPDELRPYAKEVHDFVIAYGEYPAKLAGLRLDVAVAPLELNPFNEAKSNLRLLEYGILGWSVVCTDIHPYRGAPVKRVANDAAAWIAAIRERVHDLDAAALEGERLRQWVERNHMLEDHLPQWKEALLPDQTAAGAAAAVSPAACATATTD